MSAALIPAASVPIARTDADWAFDINFDGEDWTGATVKVAFGNQDFPNETFEINAEPATADLSCAIRIPAATWAGKMTGTYSVEVRKIVGNEIDDAAVFRLLLYPGVSIANAMAAPPAGDGVASGGVIISRTSSVVVLRAAGTRGVAGPTGSSAYEVAVENGFEGTEAEWLDSLKPSNQLEAEMEQLYGLLNGGITLTPLTLSSSTINFDSVAGELIATIGGGHASSIQTITLSPNDGRMVVAGDPVNGWTLRRGMTAVTNGATVNVSLTETLRGAVGSPKTTTIPLTVVQTAAIDGNTFAPLGDSRTDILTYDAKQIQSAQQCHIVQANMRHKQPFRLTGEFATSSATSTQILTTWLTPALATMPGFLLILCGVNDPANAISTATTMANIREMCRRALAQGTRPVVFTDPGGEAFTTEQAAAFHGAGGLNDQIRAMVAADPRMVLVDWVPTLLSSTAPVTFRPGYVYEAAGLGLHLDVPGAIAGGDYMHSVLAPLVAAGTDPSPVGSPLLNTNYANPLGGSVGTGNTGATAASFTASIAPSSASFTADITATTMTVTAKAAGYIEAGQLVTGGTTTAGTRITGQVSGTPGGIGVYTVTPSQTVVSGAKIGSGPAMLNVTAFGSGLPLTVGQGVSGAGVTAGTTITALGTGTGGVGTYALGTSQTVASSALTTTQSLPASFAGARDNANCATVFGLNTRTDGVKEIVAALTANNAEGVIGGFSVTQAVPAAVTQDGSPFFVKGGKYVLTCQIDLDPGFVNVADVSVQLDLNYTDTTFEQGYEARVTGSRRVFPSGSLQQLTLRTRPVTYDAAKTLSTCNARMKARCLGSGSLTARMRNLALVRVA